MNKSRYFHYLKINEKIYAVFNSLILDVIYISKEDFNKLLAEKYDLLESQLLQKLINKGIVIRNNESDNKALKVLTDYYLKTTKRIDTLYLIVSQGCNLGCKYCFLENCDGNWKNQMRHLKQQKLVLINMQNMLLKIK